MPKPVKKDIKKHSGTPVISAPATTPVPVPAGPFYLQFKIQAIVLAVLALLFYANTFSHEFAFDDTMAIVDNEYVQEGVSGIHDILTKDAYQSYLEHKNGTNQLAGGRYRPLSLVTFAIEQQFMGAAPVNESTNDKEARVAREMHGRHVANVLLYMLSVVLLLYFLRKVVFPAAPLMAFLSALIFTIHPIHTEVVANVKSRDEILSVLFITLTFIQAFRYRQSRGLRDIVLAAVCFFMALLSKEYGIMLIVLLPLSFYLFGKETLRNSVRHGLVYLIPAGLYLLLRFSSVTAMAEGAENSVMNNPYLYASGMQKIATEILVLLDYLKLLVFPHPLSADYSFNQIAYTNFSNPLVWLSAFIYTGLTAVMCLLFIKRHVLCFAIAFYLANIALISNILFNIGAPMGERLIYHSSIGFAIAAAYLICKGTERINQPSLSKGVLAAVMLSLVILCSFTTIDRNKDWKNDETLFLTDVKISPNSVLINNNAAAACMNEAKHTNDTAQRKEWFRKAIGYFDKAIDIDPHHYPAYISRGLSYFDMGDPERAVQDWDTVRKYAPQQPNLSKYLAFAAKYYVSKGVNYGRNNRIDSAIVEFKKGTEADPELADAWILLGKSCYLLKDYPAAKDALLKANKLVPANTEVKGLLQNMGGR